MIESLKRFARRRFPAALGAFHNFRLARDVNSREVRDTPLGFRFGGHELMENGTFEPDETRLIQSFAAPGKVYVDVGANYGFFVCVARQRGAHVVAVEPMHQNLELLYRNVGANGWDDIEVLPVGLSTKPGIATLYGGGTGASLVNNWSGTSGVWKSTIALSTLDAMLSDRYIDREMLIKIDVEGFELQVLEGAARTLARTPAPLWLVEIVLTEHHPAGLNPAFRDVFELFWSAGYTPYTLGADERVVTREDVERWVTNRRRDFGTWNYVFRKQNA